MIGMIYKILSTKEFSKDLKKLDKPIQIKIKKKISEASQDPTRYKQLHYDLSGSCRIRVKKAKDHFLVR
jgi:mRNA-degrading endonuclease RelE of RelBE toxin-antitoxin system